MWPVDNSKSSFYLVPLLNICDGFSIDWIYSGECFPTHRIHKLIVDENLKNKKPTLGEKQPHVSIFIYNEEIYSLSVSHGIYQSFKARY